MDERLFEPGDVCLFEASARLGGRTYTVFAHEAPQLEGLNLDIGAYRFAFEQHLPADLLHSRLNLSIGCYIPSCKPEPLDDDLVLHKLIDPATGDSAGYGSALQVLLAQLTSAGVRVMLQHRLEAIYPSGPRDVLLHWAAVDGARPRAATHASAVLLNLPRHALQGLRSDSVVFQEAPRRTRELLACTGELYGNRSNQASVKVYLIYEDAWWLTKLGLAEGEVESLESDPPVYIRYHDGPTHCSNRSCRGALLVQYAHTLETGAGWYMKFQRDWHQPLGIFADGPLLVQVHRKLMSMHAAGLRSAGVDPDELAGPVASVVGFWRHSEQVVLSPAPDPLSFSTGTLPPCLRNVTSAEYWERTRKPVGGRQVFLANNDWWLEESSVDLMPPYWAEVSLRTAERVLHDHLGLKRPRWLSRAYFQRSVLGESSGEAVII